MIKRECPRCKTEWYSAHDSQDWICSKCQTIIPKELNNPKIYTKKHAKRD